MLLEEFGGGFQEVVGRDDPHQLIVLDDWKTTHAMRAHDVYRVQ